MAAPTRKVRGTGNEVSSLPLGEEHLQALRLELLEQLPRRNEPEPLLDCFFQAVAQHYAVARLEFLPADDTSPVTFGRGGAHSAEYQLTVENTALGSLILHRRARYSEPVLEQIERLLQSLVWPLRTALLYRQALELAMRDVLTGLGNRTALDITLERELALARRHGTPLALIVIDLDHFKRVNDEFGHDLGDRLLRDTAQILRNACRASDGVFRYGGEEFVVVLPHTGVNVAASIAARLRALIAGTSWSRSDGQLTVTASLGVAGLCPGDDVQGLFRRADQAMYRAKTAGRNRIALAREA